MNRKTLIENINKPVSRFELISRYCREKKVLDIGCVNHNTQNISSDRWLHQLIKDVASVCIGVDYMEKEVEYLKSRGYNVICADATQPIDLGVKFDVIVIGNLIEHLSNFDGLLMNVDRLLNADGYVLISTANPFYSEQYFYCAFKNDILVNPEHTCWIDPVTLEQLVRRFGFFTQSVYWIKEKWRLGIVIYNGERKSFDMLTAKWTSNSPPSIFERGLSPLLLAVFRMIFPRIAKRLLDRHGSEAKVKELVYIRFIGLLFQGFWFLYGLLIIKSPINRHELYMSVIKKGEGDFNNLIDQ